MPTVSEDLSDDGLTALTALTLTALTAPPSIRPARADRLHPRFCGTEELRALTVTHSRDCRDFHGRQVARVQCSARGPAVVRS